MWTEPSIDALLLSLRVSSISTIFIVLTGTPIAFFFVRRRSMSTRLIESLLYLPLVIPPVVTGYVLIIMLSPSGIFGGVLEAFGIRFSLDWKGAVVAAFVMAFPMYLAIASAAIEKCDRRLEDAARTLNAGSLKVLLTITLPPVVPGLIGAGALAFARSFGEFGATMMFAGNIPGQTRTVSQAIYSNLIAGRNEAAMWLAMVSIMVGITAMMLSYFILGPRFILSGKR